MKKLKENIKKILINDFNYPKNLKITYTEDNKAILTFKINGVEKTEVIDNIIDKIAEGYKPENSQSEPQPE